MDVNNDGYDDIIIGAPQHGGGSTGPGQVYVYRGWREGITTTNMLTLTVAQSAARFGGAVGTAGDVNNDTYADVIVGAYLYDGSYADEGAAYVYLGSSNGITTTGVWSTTGGQTGARLGVSVAGAGDVDNDGYADVIVGAEGYDGGHTNEGRVTVYLGSTGGITTTGAWSVESNDNGAQLGHAVGGAGDVDGDGYDDIIIGAPYYDGGATESGQAWVYLGSSGGITTTGVWTATVAQANAFFGGSVGAAGDVNGDGGGTHHRYADVIVGSMTYSNTQADEGAAFIYAGSASGLATTPAWSAESNQANARYGVSVGGAGDVNGDGAGDVIVGAYGYSGPQNGEGRAYVYHGAVTVAPAWVTRSITYTYDGLHRLTGVTYSTGESYAYEYDAVGNRVALTDTAGTTTYTYDAANRLTSIELPDSSVQTYTWDARGNLLSTGAFTYTYDAAGRMVRAESVDLTSVYTYTADGLRIAQAVDGDETRFTWDWATGVPELLIDGDKLYLVGHDTLGWEDAAGWTYAVPDALGSVRQAVDGAGELLDAREWTPYGVEVGEAQAGLGYTGEWWDAAVGLQYLRARWYDGIVGRFASLDSAPPDYQQPGSIHRYAYVENNVINFTDPSGLSPAPPFPPKPLSCDLFQTPDNGVVPGNRFSSPSACFALNWVTQRTGTFQRYASQYGVPPELPAGLLAAEIDLDHTLPGRALDELARIALLIRSLGSCDTLRGMLPFVPWAEADFYWQVISTVDKYMLMGKDLGDIVSGDAAVHHVTYVIVEEYMATHYGQPTSTGTAKPDYLAGLLTDEGTIEFTARMARMLADYRKGTQVPHTSDLDLIDMAQIWAAWRAGIGGVTCPSDRGCGFDNLQQFQDKSDLGLQAQLGYPYFEYFKRYFIR